MGIKKKFKPKESGLQTKVNGNQQIHAGKSSDVTNLAVIDAPQTEIVAGTDVQSTSGFSGVTKEKEKQKLTKSKRGLIEIIAVSLGYIKRNKVSSWITGINKSIAKDMDENVFAELPLKAKFEALSDGIAKLMFAQAQDLEKSRAAVDEANAQTERETLAKTEALASAAAAQERAIKAENRAIDAEGKANAAERRIQELSMQLTELQHKKDGKRDSDDINALIKENSELHEKVGSYEKDLKIAKNTNERLEVTNKELVREREQLKKEHIDLQTEHTNLQGTHISLQEAYDICKKRCEELEASEVGQLTDIICSKDNEINNLNVAKTATETALKQAERAKEDVEHQLEKTGIQLEEARQTIETREGELKNERNTIKELKLTVKGYEKNIEELKEQGSKYVAEIESQKTELEARQVTINEKTEEIKRLNGDNDSLHLNIGLLKDTISGLEQDKASLTATNETIRQQFSEKTNFIYAERDSYAQAMMSLAKKLSEAAAKDFLGNCDDAFESNRVSLQEKVLKPVRALEREMAEINPGNYDSRDELAEAYYALIKSQFDEASGLTRIAQWYAYSQVAFMVDKDRSDGLFVRQEEIRNIYLLAVKLMANVGIEYCLPALYAERLLDNSTYEDVTGQRQLNIEYMCPTARSHKENIDCIDSSKVIIDVVEVGYTDNKGNNKKSKVII